jgi:UDP-N-acetylglucosamine 2-epimerase (non-hydrolysing)/UDP-GlcNAc3NAcA epimerase
MKIVTIVGSHTQFIKAAPISRVLRQECQEILVHTGQHYDEMMSAVFFDALEIPHPDYNLGIGSGSHGAQTGAMLTAIEEILLTEKPVALLVYGDTNSTLAGALAAAKVHIPVAHIEAGLRSFNQRMPEEINRVLTDHVSRWLFCPTQTAIRNLRAENIIEGVWQVGDVMVDALNYNLQLAQRHSNILARFKVIMGDYYLATIHQPDDPVRLSTILQALNQLDRPVILLAHPRTSNAGLPPLDNVRLVPPVGYLDMLSLEANAHRILTDSGGVQKEAYLVGVPCITLREETEWVETVEIGWNQLVGADPIAIQTAVKQPEPAGPRPDLFGAGDASQRIVRILTGDVLP